MCEFSVFFDACTAARIAFRFVATSKAKISPSRRGSWEHRNRRPVPGPAENGAPQHTVDASPPVFQHDLAEHFAASSVSLLPMTMSRRPQQTARLNVVDRIDDESSGASRRSRPSLRIQDPRRVAASLQHERFSMALNGQTPEEKLATFYPNIASASVISWCLLIGRANFCGL